MAMFTTTNSSLIICLLILVLVSVLQLHNVQSHPINRGFDATGHIEYVSFIKTNKTLPLVVEGWEYYQPPLYYLIASVLPKIIDLKYLGFIMHIGILIIAYKIYRKLFNSQTVSIALIGVVYCATLPVALFQSISIGNEFFSALLISLTMLFYIVYYNESFYKCILLGILLGLSIEAKATALVLVASICLDTLLSNSKLATKVKGISLISLSAISFGGLHYIRNLVYFNNPLAAPNNFPKYFDFLQPIVPRSLEFFTTIKGFLTLDLFLSQHYSFLAGTYFSWFYDGHNIIVPVQEYSKSGIILFVMSIPLFIFILKGFVYSLLQWDKKSRIFVIYSILLFGAYIAYNFQLPYYSTVKGSFLVSLIIPSGYFLLRGILNLKKYLNQITFYYLIYSIILTRHFWILSWWYT